MIRSLFLTLAFLGFSSGILLAQSLIKTADLYKRTETDSRIGQLNISQNLALDTLITRYILLNKKTFFVKESNSYGMSGFRIQIYASSNRNAREESNKTRADFINKFPDIVSYQVYQDPGYFKTRVGDFRSRTEATKLFLIISKEFPDAYIVPDIINFPDLNKK